MRCFTCTDFNITRGVEYLGEGLHHSNIPIHYELREPHSLVSRQPGIILNASVKCNRGECLLLKEQEAVDQRVLIEFLFSNESYFFKYEFVGDYFKRCEGKHWITRRFMPYGRGLKVLKNSFDFYTRYCVVIMEPGTVVGLTFGAKIKNERAYVYYDGNEPKLYPSQGEFNKKDPKKEE